MTQGEKLFLIKELYEKGSSIEAIAEVTGYKVNSVKSLLPKAGIYRKRHIKDEADLIIQLRKSGLTIEKIKEKTGYDISSISILLKKAGLGKYEHNDWKAEEELIDENTVYAKKNEEKPEKIFANGRWYVTVPESVIFEH